MNGDDFRHLALALEGTVEGAHMGHADFRVGGRIFASLRADERAGTVKLLPEEQHEFVREHGSVFEPAAGAWGRQGWTSIALETAPLAAVRAALLLAWQRQAVASPRKASARRARARTRSSKG